MKDETKKKKITEKQKPTKQYKRKSNRCCVPTFSFFLCCFTVTTENAKERICPANIDTLVDWDVHKERPILK